MQDDITTPQFPPQADEADRLDQATPVLPDPEDEPGFPEQLPVDADPADAIDQWRSLPGDDDEDYPGRG